MKFDRYISEDLSLYKELLSNIRAVLYIIDIDTQSYIWASDNFLNSIGYDTEEIVLNAAEFTDSYLHPDDKIVMKQRMKSFKNDEFSVWSGVYRIKHKDGTWIWVYSKVTVYKRDKAGRPTMLLGIVLDAQEKFKTSDQLSEFSKHIRRNKNHIAIAKLTKRELEILSLIVSGYDYQEIAKKLFIQPDTVNKHRKHILKKLKLNNIASLVNFSKETGLV